MVQFTLPTPTCKLYTSKYETSCLESLQVKPPCGGDGQTILCNRGITQYNSLSLWRIMKRNCLEFTGQACARRGGGLIVHNVIPEEAVGENELFIVEVTSSQTKLFWKFPRIYPVCLQFVVFSFTISFNSKDCMKHSTGVLFLSIVNTETIPQKQQRRNRRQDELDMERP